jgi:hypothetical protein
VVGRVDNIEMIVFIAVEGVSRAVRGGRQWCGFNASISTREGRWREEALSDDEVEAANSS